ncbi:ankyrin repeat-containing domain protein [Trichophaea hybrida]|nr:ankyrin repeat-containing domain protein [Trichophaea hybrida]
MRGGTHKYGLGFKNAYSEREEREYETPLIEAVKAEDCTTTVLLLERGADIERHSEDRTALTVAAARGCLKIVQVLIEHRADVNVRGGPYGSALDAAARTNSLEVVQSLLDSHAAVKPQTGEHNQNILLELVEGTRTILRNQEPEKPPSELEFTAAERRLICEQELEKALLIATLLLDHGADINAHGGRHGTALAAAAHAGNVGMVQLLLKRRADPRAHNTNALIAAIEGSHECRDGRFYEAVVALLLDVGVDVNARGGSYGSALATATG